jgi:hypothetical protein
LHERHTLSDRLAHQPPVVHSADPEPDTMHAAITERLQGAVPGTIRIRRFPSSGIVLRGLGALILALIVAPVPSSGDGHGAAPHAPPGAAPPLYLPIALHDVGPLGTSSPAPLPTVTPPVPGPDYDALFDPDRLLDVAIEMRPADWDVLRLQARTFAGLFGTSECLTEPRPSPYTYFPADVRVDGQRVASVGVRKKGLLGSVNSVTPGLKIKFDAYVPGQRLAGMSLMTLNNLAQDPSRVRQCLAYGLFGRAGLPAPRCSFARVTVNDRVLGVYAHVESIKKPFLARHFSGTGGNLYEGALSDFRPDWVATFERDTNTSDPDRSDLDGLVAALETDDAHLLAALETVVDLPAFFDFWAMEVLTGHWDGYAANRNNFYVYRDPGSGRFTFIPWGIDATFRDNARQRPDGATPVTSVAVTGRLAYRLYRHPEGRRRYLARLEALLADVWDEPSILAEVDRMVALVRPGIPGASAADFERDVATLRDFVTRRRAAIGAELGIGGIDWPFPESGAPCRQTVGHFHAPFTMPWAVPAAISTTVRADLFGTSVEFTTNYAVATASGAEPWPAHTALQIVGVADHPVPPIWQPGDALQVILYVDPARFGSRRTIAVDGNDAFGWVILAPLNADGTRRFVLLGMLWGGDLTLDAVDARPGGMVSGVLDADIVVFGGL